MMLHIRSLIHHKFGVNIILLFFITIIFIYFFTICSHIVPETEETASVRLHSKRPSWRSGILFSRIVLMLSA